MYTTKVHIPESNVNISYTDKIMTLGSCFAENIGKRLEHAYFQVNINPFGVLYNPLSVVQSLKTLLDKHTFTSEEVFEYQSLWSSFSHSSLFSGVTREACLAHINTSTARASEEIVQSRFLLITLGTAWVYEDVGSGQVVANCHKLPANRFTRRKLEVGEITEKLTDVLREVKGINPLLEVLITVSPIRHWKDGAHENNISKATLLLAVEALRKELAFVHYFPAYEIQLDELRDYRYYASDMLHPSETAVDYIWQRFSDTYFDANTLQLKKELEQLRADFNHRPLHPDTAQYNAFLQSREKRKGELIGKYPPLAHFFVEDNIT